MAKKADKPKKPTVAEVKKYLSLKEDRSKLGKQIDAIEREESILKTKITDWVKYSAGLDKLCKLGAKLQGMIKTRKGSVRWKDEFINVAGADAAVKLSDSAKRTERLDVIEG